MFWRFSYALKIIFLVVIGDCIFLMTGFLQTNYRFAFSYHSVFHSFLLVIIFAFDMKIQLKIWLLYNSDTLSSSHCLQCCIKTDLISLSCCDQQSSLLAWVLHRCLFVIWHLDFLNLVVTSFTNGELINLSWRVDEMISKIISFVLRSSSKLLLFQFKPNKYMSLHEIRISDTCFPVYQRYYIGFLI